MSKSTQTGVWRTEISNGLDPATESESTRILQHSHNNQKLGYERSSKKDIVKVGKGKIMDRTTKTQEQSSLNNPSNAVNNTAKKPAI